MTLTPNIEGQKARTIRREAAEERGKPKPKQSTIAAWAIRVAIIGVALTPLAFDALVLTVLVVLAVFPVILRPMSSTAWLGAVSVLIVGTGTLAFILSFL